MKKVLSLVLCLALVATLALAACNNGNGGSSAGEGDGSAAADASQYALLLTGNLGDRSLSDSAWIDGMQKAEKDLGIKAQLAELKNDKTKREPALLEWCDDAIYEIIFIGFYDNKELAETFAVNYPDQKFCTYDFAPDFTGGAFPNVFGIAYAQNEVSYLAGFCAAGMSKTGTIGVVGASDIEVINDFILGYYEGAQAKNPAIRVLTAYNNASWEDVALMKELTLNQITLKADVTFQVAGGAGQGMYEAAAEKGTWAIAVDGDHYNELKPSKPDIVPAILTSAMKKVGESLYWAIQHNEAGDLKFGSGQTLGVKEGTVGLARNENYEKNVPAELKAEIDAIEADISAGKVKVGTAFGMATEDFKAITNRLKGA